MAGEYNINWTDDQGGANPLKPRFVINPNEVNGPGNANAHSPLQLPGRFAVNYGEIIAENFLHLMENFSSPSEPPYPTSGMLWFDNSEGDDGTLKVRNKDNNGWVVVGTGAGGGASGGAGGAPAIPPSGPGTDFNAVAGGNYFVDTSTTSVTVTLPANPDIGAVIGFTDVAGTFDINSLYLNGNGEEIMGDPSNMENDVKYSSFRIGYAGPTYGWRLVA